MPRSKRADEAGAIYHAMNRGNLRADLFHKPADYEAFLRLLGEGLEKYPLEIFSIALMPNHWHLVLRPAKDGQMGRLLGWLSATHTLRYRAHNHRDYPGHLYQGPFKSFPVADDEHFTLCAVTSKGTRCVLTSSRGQRIERGLLCTDGISAATRSQSFYPLGRSNGCRTGPSG